MNTTASKILSTVSEYMGSNMTLRTNNLDYGLVIKAGEFVFGMVICTLYHWLELPVSRLAFTPNPLAGLKGNKGNDWPAYKL